MTSIVQRFLHHALATPQAPAIAFEKTAISYAELWEEAQWIHSALNRVSASAFVAVWADKSLAMYAGVLGALLAGKTFVPLNPSFPVKRSQGMLAASAADVVIVSAESAPAAVKALYGVPYTLVCPDEKCPEIVSQTFFTRADCSSEAKDACATPPHIAYIMFTSGSTGKPKGVAVSHAAVCTYLDAAAAFHALTPEDRCSQLFDLTFDLSMHDLFATWQAGACLCIPTNAERLSPAQYIHRARLTSWFSVPSVLLYMAQLRQMEAGAYPQIRLSLFCGEALPVRLLEQWATAAPASRLENLYGPTESTIAMSRYAWQREQTGGETYLHGLVPLGRPYPQVACSVRDEQGQPLAAGQTGELWIRGSQLAEGYLNATLTAAVFVEHDGHRWYKTGDAVAEDASGNLHFVSRLDTQVKLRGFRIEVAEVECILSSLEGIRAAVVVPVHDENGMCQHLHAYLLGTGTAQAVLLWCRKALPGYMIPRYIEFVDSYPLNSNEKTDRPQLAIRAKEHHDRA